MDLSFAYSKVKIKTKKEFWLNFVPAYPIYDKFKKFYDKLEENNEHR